MTSSAALHRSAWARVATAGAFACVVLCFFLPFLAVSEERTARATGLQLATARARFSGSYVHGSYAGEVERIVRRTRGPAVAALVLATVGFAAAWLPGIRATWAAFVVALLALAAFGLLWQSSTNPFLAADRRYGFWLAFVFTGGAVVLLALRLRSYYRQWSP